VIRNVGAKKFSFLGSFCVHGTLVVDFSTTIIILFPSFQRFVHEMNSFCEKSSHGVMLQEGSHQLNPSGGLGFSEVVADM
jgi:hypothetical protein